MFSPLHTTRLFIIAFAALFLAACGQGEEQQATTEEAQSLTEYLEQVTMDQIKESPESITFLGMSEEDIGRKTSHLLDDRSPAQEAEFRALFTDVAEALEVYDRDSLSEDEKVYLDISNVVNERGTALLDFKVPFSPNFPTVYRITQLSGVHLNIPQLLQSAHPMASKEDAEDFIARLNEINRTFGEFLETWKAETDAGYIPPTFALEKTSATLAPFTGDDPTQNPFYAIFASRLDGIEGLGDEDKAGLLAAASDAIANSVAPAYGALKDAVDALIPASSPDAGVWAKPDGDAYYAAAVRIFGDTDLSPEEIHNIGLAEVARISDEIDAIFNGEGITEGTVGERMAALKEDPAMVYPNTDEGREQLLAFLQENKDLMDALVPEAFGTIPEIGVEIQRVPEFSEASAPGGYYSPPSLDGSRPGIFWINLRDTAEQQLWTLKTLLYHEAVPGHHFELALAFTSADRPIFRRSYFNSNYSEGWALYAEKVAHELGAYEGDPFGDIGRLQAELWRAVRLVVDTGMHYKRWTREQAIEYMESTLGSEHDSVVTEIERYAVWPGQALGYKMGMLKILELRARAREAMGGDFDIKAFHDIVLGKGSMPMVVVESRVDEWIAASPTD